MPRKIKSTFINDPEKLKSLEEKVSKGDLSPKMLKAMARLDREIKTRERELVKKIFPALYGYNPLRKPRSRKEKVMTNGEIQKNYREKMKSKGLHRLTFWVYPFLDRESAYIPVRVHKLNRGICEKEPDINTALLGILEKLDKLVEKGSVPKSIVTDIEYFFQGLGVNMPLDNSIFPD